MQSLSMPNWLHALLVSLCVAIGSFGYRAAADHLWYGWTGLGFAVAGLALAFLHATHPTRS